MSSGPRGQGRKANERLRQEQHTERCDRQMTLLSKSTGRRLPEWMTDPSTLPRKPPRKDPTNA